MKQYLLLFLTITALPAHANILDAWRELMAAPEAEKRGVPTQVVLQESQKRRNDVDRFILILCKRRDHNTKDCIRSIYEHSQSKDEAAKNVAISMKMLNAKPEDIEKGDISVEPMVTPEKLNKFTRFRRIKHSHSCDCGHAHHSEEEIDEY